jgi:hypothetical protein
MAAEPLIELGQSLAGRGRPFCLPPEHRPHHRRVQGCGDVVPGEVGHNDADPLIREV